MPLDFPELLVELTLVYGRSATAVSSGSTPAAVGRRRRRRERGAGGAGGEREAGARGGGGAGKKRGIIIRGRETHTHTKSVLEIYQGGRRLNMV